MAQTSKLPIAQAAAKECGCCCCPGCGCESCDRYDTCAKAGDGCC